MLDQNPLVAAAAHGRRYRLPAGERLVADVVMFRGAGAYTYSRPLFDHELAASTIHQNNVDTSHRPSAEVRRPPPPKKEEEAELPPPRSGKAETGTVPAAAHGLPFHLLRRLFSLSFF